MEIKVTCSIVDKALHSGGFYCQWNLTFNPYYFILAFMITILYLFSFFFFSYIGLWNKLVIEEENDMSRLKLGNLFFGKLYIILLRVWKSYNLSLSCDPNISSYILHLFQFSNLLLLNSSIYHRFCFQGINLFLISTPVPF